MEDIDVTPTVHSAMRAASTVASAASRGASAAAHGAKVAAEIFAPPATAAPRSPMSGFVLALLAAEIAVLVVLAVPFAVPGRARAVAMLSLSPGAERVRWVLYTTLAGLGGLLWDAGRRWNGAEKEVKNLMEDQPKPQGVLRHIYALFEAADRLHPRRRRPLCLLPHIRPPLPHAEGGARACKEVRGAGRQSDAGAGQGR
ncbi:hypothetical protein DFJ74DRAFT_692966, partial [Hyaloraphidium curvatum]